MIDHYLGSTTSPSGVAPRAAGVPPPLPGHDEPTPPVADGDRGKTRDPGPAGRPAGVPPALPGKPAGSKGGR